MSSTQDATEDTVDTENVGGLEEVLPEPLVPVWRRIELIQEFRETHGDKYVKFFEVITALGLIGGYIYWLTLFL